MKKKTAIIFGVTGQDGSYLSEILLEKNYNVHGVKRKSSSFNTSRIDHIYESKQKKYKSFYLHYGDITDSSFVIKILSQIYPDEVYNLAAQSHVAVSFHIPEYTANVNALGTLRILEAVRMLIPKKKIKFYQASTSELFGNSKEKKQSEKTVFSPSSPYAIAKLFSYYVTENYRKAYNIYASNGILFNHESSRRGETFVTRKISMSVSNIVFKKQNVLYLGNIDSKRDWGHAKEYAEMQWRILQQKKPDDYVISTDKQYSIRQFVEYCFKYVGVQIRWVGKGINEKGVISNLTPKKYSLNHLKKGQKVVELKKKYFRPSDVVSLNGDSSKARRLLNWKPKYKINDIVEEMMNSDLKKTEDK